MHGPHHPSFDGSDDRSQDGMHGQAFPARRRQRRPRLSDATIAEVAGQIAQAMPPPTPGDQTTWILAHVAELPAEDESRVIRVLTDPSRAPQSGPRP